MRENEGYAILQEYVGKKPLDCILPGTRIEGTPMQVCSSKRKAIRAVEELIAEEGHNILWIKTFNKWPTYHTYYQFSDGERIYYFWYIYG